MTGTRRVLAPALRAPRVGPRSRCGLAVGLALLLLTTACGKPAVVAAPMAPAFPSFEFPEPTAIDPAPLPALVERHQGAWNLLQAGQPRSAARAYADIISKAPAFFPAKAGLGYSELAERNYKAAVNAFDATLAQSPHYIPALSGRVEALLASERPIEAIGALEALLSADPSRTTARTRLESLRLSTIDALVEEGRQARQRGELERAREAWTRALQAAPESAFMYRELAGIERQIGRLDDARGHALAAIRLDERDVPTQLLLGEIESARGDLAAALAAFRRAQELDARADYRARIADLERRQALAALPEAYRTINTRPQITRGDLAALAGVALDPWLARAGSGSAPLVTDVRGHWAQRWILLTTAAGVMEVYANHTFQASAAVRRSDIASLVQRTLERAAALDPAQAATRRPTSATFSDLPPTHASYPAAAVAVGSGVMQVDPGDLFAPQRLVTGAEASAIVERLAAQVLRP